jgi:tetratricopeptide (TPR) repeat protein
VSIFESLIDMDLEHKLELLSAIGRIYLQLGNISAAMTTFGEVEAVCGPEQVAMVKMNRGLVQVALANYKEGQQVFQEVVQSEPNNALVSIYIVVRKMIVGSTNQVIYLRPHPPFAIVIFILYSLQL